MYENREDLIKKYILKEISYQVSEPEALFLDPLVVFETLRLFRKITFTFRYGWKRNFVNLIKQIYEKNLQAFLESAAPKVVLTFVDDSGVFHRLSKECKGSVFLLSRMG